MIALTPSPPARAGATPDDLERFRDALRRAIRRSGLRVVAREVCMSPSGLQKFIDGTIPYSRTVERVRSWYFRKAGLHEVPPDEIADSLSRFVATLPDPTQGVLNLLSAIDQSYAEQGMLSPSWIIAVRSRLAA